jgi:hypothetical protein
MPHMTDSKSKRGGRRPGQGRPALGVRRVSATLDEATIAMCRETGGGEMLRGIRIAVASYAKAVKNER